MTTSQVNTKYLNFYKQYYKSNPDSDKFVFNGQTIGKEQATEFANQIVDNENQIIFNEAKIKEYLVNTNPSLINLTRGIAKVYTGVGVSNDMILQTMQKLDDTFAYAATTFTGLSDEDQKSLNKYVRKVMDNGGYENSSEMNGAMEDISTLITPYKDKITTPEQAAMFALLHRHNPTSDSDMRDLYKKNGIDRVYGNTIPGGRATLYTGIKAIRESDEIPMNVTEGTSTLLESQWGLLDDQTAKFDKTIKQATLDTIPSYADGTIFLNEASVTNLDDAEITEASKDGSLTINTIASQMGAIAKYPKASEITYALNFENETVDAIIPITFVSQGGTTNDNASRTIPVHVPINNNITGKSGLNIPSIAKTYENDMLSITFDLAKAGRESMGKLDGGNRYKYLSFDFSENPPTVTDKLNNATYNITEAPAKALLKKQFNRFGTFATVIVK